MMNKNGSAYIMVKLKRMVTEANNHIDNLIAILKLFSKDPDNWSNEWVINPYYMVDLGHYGAGNCMCGHNIRYQYQFKNTTNGKTLPVGSVCVTLLGLGKFDETLDQMERVRQMATVDLDLTKDKISFVKDYRKFFSPENVEALRKYIDVDVNSYDYKIFVEFSKARKFSEGLADRMMRVILDLHAKAKKVISDIEKNSEPVTKDQVRDLVEFSNSSLANAKQLSLF